MENSKLYSNGKVWIINIHLALSSFIGFYTMGAFNSCQQNISASLSWGSNESFYIALFSAFIPAGAVIGTLLIGYSMSHFGRRSTIIFTDILYITATAIILIPSTIAFAIGRLLTGLCVGIQLGIGPIYSIEVTPEALVSKIGPLITLGDEIGLLIAYSFSLPLPTKDFNSNPFNNWWYFVFLFPALLSAYQLVFFMCWWKHDTPQYYMTRKMDDRARAALRDVYREGGMDGAIRRINSEFLGKMGSGDKVSLKMLVCEKRFRKMMRVGNVLCLFSQLSGFTAIVFYSSFIFEKLGGGVFVSRILTFVIGLVNIITALFTFLLLDWFGRKALLVSGQFLLFINLGLLGIFSGYVDVGVSVPAVLVLLSFCFFTYSLSATLWIYIGEVLNDEVYSFCVVSWMISAMITTFTFPLAAESVGINNCFIFCSIMMLFGAIYAWIDVVETKDLDKTEILTRMKCLDNIVMPSNQNLEEDNIKMVEVAKFASIEEDVNNQDDF